MLRAIILEYAYADWREAYNEDRHRGQSVRVTPKQHDENGQPIKYPRQSRINLWHPENVQLAPERNLSQKEIEQCLSTEKHR